MERALRDAVGRRLGAPVIGATVVHGGDVAAAFRFDLADGRRVFAKTHPAAPAGFFTTEAKGLSWLRSAGAVTVPEIFGVSDGGDDEPAHLVLEWIETGSPRPSTDADFGRALAGLHLAGAPCFGREDRRTTGSRGLPNEPCATWAQFYATDRLLPLARLATGAGALPPTIIAALEDLADRLDGLGGPPEPPARLHGDLWAGNRLIGVGGRSWLIDPAAHGGHREFDLAMMRLFGGFGSVCFEAYEEVHPLADGWRDRVALHHIAPLVVHAVKFGAGYVRGATDAILRYR